MITADMKAIIENNACALATIDDEGYSHLIAVSMVKVVGDDQLLISDNYMKETIRNIMRNKNATILVWNKDWEEECLGVEMRGFAEYSTIGKWYDMMKAMPENAGLPRKGVILVTVKKVKRLG